VVTETAMQQHHKVTVPLGHRISLASATRFLLHYFDCDSWYVAAQRDHLFVLHLTRGNVKRYAVCLECTKPVDKAIYHDALVSSVSVLPLGSQHDLLAKEIGDMKSGLLELARGEEVC
jgi:hypothetical protein